MRALVVIVALAVACTPKRAAVVGGTTIVGSLGVGLPLARDCSLDATGNCASYTYPLYLGIGAAVGAALGMLAITQLDDDGPRPGQRVFVPTESLVFDAPASPAVTWVEDAYVTADGIGLLPACLAAKRIAADQLERRCGALDQHTLLGATCDCGHDGDLDLDRCRVEAEATCGQAAAPRRFGFAVASAAVARAHAEAAASARCTASGGAPGAVAVACTCLDDDCGCVADVVCAPREP